ncbi:DUF2865 domain-containing protein [Nitratireductor kimnyeongensis]|uniref:DUF2865 domain-containing protein n=1 Tax=Nitratireductor kimnyeongensis TaxID=430679 RepID=A0ABW0T953_9HYPH|nr:DUF2865 domain-containing protein [Nitratireductor kimnyeongensis]QZZ35679.1 DUF2865 domain-containing protein [Nitratireductor kimnyeongensis]
MRLGGKYLVRLIFLAFAAAPIAATPLVQAEAASRICKTLEAQLAATPSGSSSKSRSYARAIAKQQHQLGIVRSRMKQAKCGFGIFGNRIAQCAQLRKSAASMENNLTKLRQMERRTNVGSKAGRASIQARLRANNCYDKGTTRTRKNSREPAKRTATSEPRKRHRPSTVFQTMCVRTCDGYYFPISFSVSKDKFSRDETTCMARCPGAEVALYAHDVLNEEAEDMVSTADGTPYRELPKAFSYRSTGVSNKACSCRKDRRFTIVAGEKAVDARPISNEESTSLSEVQSVTKEMTGATSSSFYVAVPPKREAAQSEVAEPIVVEPVADDSPPPTRSFDDEAAQRPVRIVGPAFLPDPEGAIDLRAPAPVPAP